MYFGVEHGTFNTAAYASCATWNRRLYVFGGLFSRTIQLVLVRLRLLRTLIRLLEEPGVMGLADNSVIELFIRINTFVSPFRAESSGRRSRQPAPFFKAALTRSSEPVPK